MLYQEKLKVTNWHISAMANFHGESCSSLVLKWQQMGFLWVLR